jgi:hypothetical protein
MSTVRDKDLLQQSAEVVENLLEMIYTLLEPGLPPYPKLSELIREAEELKQEIKRCKQRV